MKKVKTGARIIIENDEASGDSISYTLNKIKYARVQLIDESGDVIYEYTQNYRGVTPGHKVKIEPFYVVEIS